MWEKIKAFWAKHISTLGRVKKALDSMKAKVAASSGKFKDKADLEQAPAGLADAFPSKGAIDSKAVGGFIQAHADMTGTVEEVIATISTTNVKAADAVAAAKAASTNQGLMNAIATDLGSKVLGTKAAPLVGGVYISFELEVDAAEGTVIITTNRETLEDKDSKVKLIFGDKGALKTVLDNTLAVINSTIKIKDKSAKAEEAVKKLMDAMGKAVNDQVTGDNAEEIKALRNIMKVCNTVNAKTGSVNVEVISQNVRLAKAVLGFAALSLKNFKPV
jgi:hypothetical protein